MKIELVSKQENKLLNRLEVQFVVSYDEGATPTRDAVRDELTKILKVKGGPLVIDHINTEFGKRESRGYAKVYSSMKDAARVERKHILERNRLLEQKPQAEKAESEGEGEETE